MSLSGESSGSQESTNWLHWIRKRKVFLRSYYLKTVFQHASPQRAHGTFKEEYNSVKELWSKLSAQTRTEIFA